MYGLCCGACRLITIDVYSVYWFNKRKNMFKMIGMVTVGYFAYTLGVISAVVSAAASILRMV